MDNMETEDVISIGDSSCSDDSDKLATIKLARNHFVPNIIKPHAAMTESTSCTSSDKNNINYNLEISDEELRRKRAYNYEHTRGPVLDTLTLCQQEWMSPEVMERLQLFHIKKQFEQDQEINKTSANSSEQIDKAYEANMKMNSIYDDEDEDEEEHEPEQEEECDEYEDSEEDEYDNNLLKKGTDDDEDAENKFPNDVAHSSEKQKHDQEIITEEQKPIKNHKYHKDYKHSSGESQICEIENNKELTSDEEETSATDIQQGDKLNLGSPNSSSLSPSSTFSEAYSPKPVSSEKCLVSDEDEHPEHSEADKVSSNNQNQLQALIDKETNSNADNILYINWLNSHADFEEPEKSPTYQQAKTPNAYNAAYYPSNTNAPSPPIAPTKDHSYIEKKVLTVTTSCDIEIMDELNDSIVENAQTALNSTASHTSSQFAMSATSPKDIKIGKNNTSPSTERVVPNKFDKSVQINSFEEELQNDWHRNILCETSYLEHIQKNFMEHNLILMNIVSRQSTGQNENLINEIARHVHTLENTMIKMQHDWNIILNMRHSQLELIERLKNPLDINKFGERPLHNVTTKKVLQFRSDLAKKLFIRKSDDTEISKAKPNHNSNNTNAQKLILNLVQSSNKTKDTLTQTDLRKSEEVIAAINRRWCAVNEQAVTNQSLSQVYDNAMETDSENSDVQHIERNNNCAPNDFNFQQPTFHSTAHSHKSFQNIGNEVVNNVLKNAEYKRIIEKTVSHLAESEDQNSSSSSDDDSQIGNNLYKSLIKNATKKLKKLVKRKQTEKRNSAVLHNMKRCRSDSDSSYDFVETTPGTSSYTIREKSKRYKPNCSLLLKFMESCGVIPYCHYCTTEKALVLCPNCHKQWYCSKTCMYADTMQHKYTCEENN